MRRAGSSSEGPKEGTDDHAKSRFFDHRQSLPAIQALITEHQPRETWLVARASGQAVLADRITGLGGCVHEDGFEPAGAGDSFFDLRDHALQRDHWWGSPEFDRAVGPLAINEILARICADFGIPADFSQPVALLARRARPEVRDAVLLASEVLQEARAYRAREEAAHAFGDAESFLEEFFPGRADELRQYQDGPYCW